LIRFQADADINPRLLTLVYRLEPAIDFASALNPDLTGMPDAHVLELAANQSRILVTNDRNTMIDHFRRRIEAGRSSPAVFFVLAQNAPVAAIAEAIILIWATSTPADWADGITYLPSLSPHIFPR